MNFSLHTAQKRCAPLLFALLAALVLVVLWFCLGIAFEYTTTAPVTTGSYTMQDGETLTQESTGFSGTLHGLVFSFEQTNTTVGAPDIDLTIEVYKNDTLLQQWQLTAEEMRYAPLRLRKGVAFLPEDTLRYTIHAVYTGNNALVLHTCASSTGYLSSLSGTSGSGIALQLLCEHTKVRGRVTVLLTVWIVLLLLFACRRIDFRHPHLLRWGVLALTAALGILFISADLFQHINSNVVVSSYVVNDETKDSLIGRTTYQLDSGNEWESHFMVHNVQPDTLDFVCRSELTPTAHIQLVNENTGAVYLDRAVSAEEYLADERSDKPVLSFSAIAIGIPEGVFPFGYYTVRILNEGDATLTFDALPDGAGGLTIDVMQLRSTGLAYYMAAGILMLLLGYLFFITLWFDRRSFAPEKFFLVTVLPLGVIYFLLVPPRGLNDTASHMAAAFRLANMVLGHTGTDAWTARADDANFFTDIARQYANNPEVANYLTIFSNLHLRTVNTQLVDFAHDVKMEYYSIINYLPQVVGLCMGRLLGLSSVLTVGLARMCILTVYIAACYHAIKVTPICKTLFALIPLLPASMNVSSSFSYDAMVLVIVLNFIANIFRLADARGNKRFWAETLCWAFLLGAVKGGGYLILLPLVLLLVERPLKNCAAQILSTLAAAGGAAYLFDVILPSGAKLFQFGGQESTALATSFAFQYPVQYFTMMVRTYLQNFDYYVFSTIGSHLGWTESTIPGVLVMLLFGCVLLITLHEKDRPSLTKRERGIFGIIIAISLLFTPMMMLKDTKIGALVIDGIQGRYYIPLLPFIGMLLTRSHLHREVRDSDADAARTLTANAALTFAALSCICVYCMLRLYLTR